MAFFVDSREALFTGRQPALTMRTETARVPYRRLLVDDALMGPRRQPIEPQSVDFDWLFSDKPFRVPRYQRAFDWGPEQMLDFANDVYALAAGRISGGGRRRHFFGAIISVAHNADHYFEVVDGQQRLTVQALALHELRNRMANLVALECGDEERRDAAVAEITARLGSQASPRLELSRRDNAFFGDLVSGTARKPKRADAQSHRRLWAAREALRTLLFDRVTEGSRDDAEVFERLVALQMALLQDGYLVHLYTHERSEAHRLFSVLNDRGRPLSDGALLRTHTLAELERHRPLQAAAEEDWDAILRVGDTFANGFLAAYYASFQGERVPTGAMYDRFREAFFPADVATDAQAVALRQRVRSLREETDIFSRIQAGDWPFDEPTVRGWDRDRLKRLVLSLRHNLAHPLLLAVARETDEKAFRSLVLLLEPFVFRYINVSSASAAKLAPIYYSHARRVRETQKFDRNGLRNRLAALVADNAADDLFTARLRDQLRYAKNAQRRQLIKHFLTTLDDYEEWYLAGARGKRRVNSKAAVHDLDQVNIEHIYPQNPQQLDGSLEDLKHHLGNLTPLDDVAGARAGNAPFEEKKETYARSRFAVTRPLADLSEWNDEAVRDRFNFYAERAKKIFVVE